jgi:glycosyltransferase involved in cell wall biosynthesis
VPDVFRELRDLVGEVFAGLTQDQLASPFPVPALAPHVGTGIDIVFFWKQNDTGLYGRRSDMMAKYLLRSGRINRILFFDAPISIKQIRVLAEKAGRSPNDQASLVLRNTLARWQKGLDQPRLLQRSFIYRESSAERLMARDLPAAEAFPDFVKSEMQDAGFASDRTIAWVCPVVWGFADLARRIGFRACVADLIDDQRAWDIHPNYRRKLDDAYRLSLSEADVVFTNCEPVALAFKDYAHDIHIVPNGAERFDQVAEVKPFAPDPGAPVIGYVGTLRDRIDWPLVESIATRRPDWSFLLAGEAQDNPSVAQLDQLPNVTFPGVVEYPRLLSFLRHLDVGIVPHLVCGLTESMNPLKVYNYFAAGLPIVATELPNVVEMDSFMHKVRDAEEMIAAIEACLHVGRRAGPDPRRNAYIEQISWEARVREVLRVLDPLLNPAFTPAGDADVTSS